MSSADSTPSRDTLLRAGQLAHQVGVSVETLRYYERLGLLSPSIRTPGGQRLHPCHNVQTMQVIKTLQHLGFSLTAIAELFTSTATHQDDTTQTHHELLDDINVRLADLEAIRHALATTAPFPCTLPSQHTLQPKPA